MTTHTYAGHTAKQIRAAAEAGLWSQFINVARPETVLALLDRIAELEQQQRQMADDVAVIQRIHGEQKAGLYGRIAELEQRATRAQPAE